MLVPNASLILRRAWSVRLAALSGVFGVLSAIEPALPILGPYVPHGTMTILASLCAFGVVMARVVSQANLSEGNTP